MRERLRGRPSLGAHDLFEDGQTPRERPQLTRVGHAGGGRHGRDTVAMWGYLPIGAAILVGSERLSIYASFLERSSTR
ncbi:hypothetical protein GCM10029978_081020 [Actinoallomurus acanthiterrae]